MPEVYLKTEFEREIDSGGGVWSCGGDLHIGPRWSCAYASNIAMIYLPSIGLLMKRLEKIYEGKASGLRFYDVKPGVKKKETFGRMVIIDEAVMKKISDTHASYLARLEELDKKCEEKAKSEAFKIPGVSKDIDFVGMEKHASLLFARRPLDKELFDFVESSVPGASEYLAPSVI